MAFLELFNFLIYAIVLFVFWRRNKTINAFFVLLSGYVVTAFLCFLYQSSGQSEYYSTTFFPYLFLFICIIICLLPFKNLNIEHLDYIKNSSTINLLKYIFIVSGIISIIYTIPNTISLFYDDQWALVRQSLYEGEDMELYHSPLERFCKNIHSYLTPFGIVMCFYELGKPKMNKLLVYLLFGTWLLNSFLSATLVASRGIVAYVLLTVLLTLVIFKKNLNAKTKRLFSFIMIILAIPLVIYLSIISISRFGEDDAGSSIYMYLGHSMQCFNERIMGSMHDFAGGKYALNFFYGNAPINMKALGNTADSGFYTYVGDFYIDWGPLGTFILCIGLAVFLNKFTQKRVKTLSDLVIIVYFASFFMRGIFVFGRGYALQWVMLVVVYIIVKIAEKTNKKAI